MYALRQVAVLQEWIKCGKIMTSVRLSTEAMESCFRRVICKGMQEGKPPASTTQLAFWVLPKEAESDILCLLKWSRQLYDDTALIEE